MTDYKEKLNYHIVRFNDKLRNYVSKFQNVKFVDINEKLRPQYYARDLIHLNRQDKSMLCNKIVKCIESYSSLNSRPNPESIICHDLIVLNDFEESLQTHITKHTHIFHANHGRPGRNLRLSWNSSQVDSILGLQSIGRGFEPVAL